MNSYDKMAQKYVSTWLRNEESGKDHLRIQYIDPHVSQFIQSLPPDASILDVGCGWGKAIESLSADQQYTGIDPYEGFLAYARQTYPDRSMQLLQGSLPDSLPVPDASYDATLCSMTLHCVADVRGSIEALFHKTKPDGRVALVSFADKAKPALIDSATHIHTLDDRHISGTVRLSSGYEVETDIFFHRESYIEVLLDSYCEWDKHYLGEFFVSYDCVKS